MIIEHKVSYLFSLRACKDMFFHKPHIKVFLRYHLFVLLSRKTPDNSKCGVFALQDISKPLVAGQKSGSLNYFQLNRNEKILIRLRGLVEAQSKEGSVSPVGVGSNLYHRNSCACSPRIPQIRNSRGSRGVTRRHVVSKQVTRLPARIFIL